MNVNKKNIIMGVFFLILAAICLVSLVTQGMTSYYVTGLILFTVVAIAFLRRGRSVR